MPLPRSEIGVMTRTSIFILRIIAGPAFFLNYFNRRSLTGFIFPTFVTSNFPGYYLIGVRPSMIQAKWGRAGIQCTRYLRCV